MLHRETITPTRHVLLAELTVKHAHDVLGFLRTHHDAGTPASRIRVRRAHLWLLRFGERELGEARARVLAASYPAHHQLWLCIHRSEGAWNDRDSGHNGHYGGLQMHPGWGYGTSYHASEDSQLTQEWAAERGYAASRYSRGWLNGQWGQTIGPCWGYA